MLCGSISKNVAPVATRPVPKNADRKHFTTIRKLLECFYICLIISFGCLLFTQRNQLSDLESSVRGLIDIIGNDDVLPPRPMAPTPRGLRTAKEKRKFHRLPASALRESIGIALSTVSEPMLRH
jgi:hypothetical protein